MKLYITNKFIIINHNLPYRHNSDLCINITKTDNFYRQEELHLYEVEYFYIDQIHYRDV